MKAAKHNRESGDQPDQVVVEIKVPTKELRRLARWLGKGCKTVFSRRSLMLVSVIATISVPFIPENPRQKLPNVSPRLEMPERNLVCKDSKIA
jgi:hypothetical protein